MSETKKKKWEELRKPFAKNVVKPAPKGGFGSYVPHHIYTRRLVDSGFPYSFRTLEVIKGTNGYVIAVVCELDIDGNVVAETGDVDQNVYTRVKNGTQSEGELVKFAVSDAFKRCMMRHGVGLELWEQDLSEEEHQIGVSEDVKPTVQTTTEPKKKVVNQEKKEYMMTKETGKSLSDNASQLNELMAKMETNEKRRKTYQIEAYNKCIDKKFPPEVKEWDAKQMGVFLDLFEQAMNIANDELEKPFEDKVSDVETILKTTVDVSDLENTGGGEDMTPVADGEWQEKPVSEAQLKWVKDIVAKATDQNLEGLAELKELYGDGNITSGVASQIITDWKDKV